MRALFPPPGHQLYPGFYDILFSVALAKEQDLLHEVLYPQDFLYSVTLTPTEIRTINIQVAMSFKFGANPIYSFLGTEETSLSSDQNSFYEAESFIIAAQKAWHQYRHSEKNSAFVQEKLLNQWEKIRGEDLTGKVLEFNTGSDEIISKPRK